MYLKNRLCTVIEGRSGGVPAHKTRYVPNYCHQLAPPSSLDRNHSLFFLWIAAAHSFLLFICIVAAAIPKWQNLLTASLCWLCVLVMSVLDPFFPITRGYSNMQPRNGHHQIYIANIITLLHIIYKPDAISFANNLQISPSFGREREMHCKYRWEKTRRLYLL